VWRCSVTLTKPSCQAPRGRKKLTSSVAEIPRRANSARIAQIARRTF